MAITDKNKVNVKHIIDRMKAKHKAKQRATMKYQGSFLIPLEITPRPQHDPNKITAIGWMRPIDNLHCTLMLPRELKPLKEKLNCSNKELKDMLKEFVATHPAPPIPRLGAKVHTATRHVTKFVGDDVIGYTQRTAFLRVINRKEMQDYLDTVTDALGLPRRERFFHVSIANETGNGQDSIGDISASDCTYGDGEE